MPTKLRKFYTEEYDFTPTTAQLADTNPVAYPMFTVPAGWRVVQCDIRILVPFAAGAPTISVGDDGTADGFIEAADITIGTAGIYPGKAAFNDNQFGKLYTADNTVDLTYTGDALTTAGAAKVMALLVKVF